MFSFFKNRRRKQLLAEPLAAYRREIITRNVAAYSRLSRQQQEQLETATKIIAAERPFFGVGEFEITDEVLVTIAAQASVLILNGDGYYFDRVGAILVHATQPKVRVAHPLGGAVLIEEGVTIDGQHLEQGEVRLAWDEALYGGQDAADGVNVVLHEFAHHLDWLDGEVEGTPPLVSATQQNHWRDVLDETMDLLRHQHHCHQHHCHQQPCLPPHAANNTAELFAYGSECYFEQPQELAAEFPAFFDCLLSFYKTDPRAWFT